MLLAGMVESPVDQTGLTTDSDDSIQSRPLKIIHLGLAIRTDFESVFSSDGGRIQIPICTGAASTAID
jgi:hypothetical protein